MAVEADLVLRRDAAVLVANAHAFGNPDLRLDDVDAGDLLGHRVLDLNARIHLDEVVGGGVGVHQELDRAGVAVADLLGQTQRGSAQLGTGFFVEIGRRGALDHLLVASLHRAVALEQVDEVAVGVAQHLHFHMAGAAHEFFEIDLVVTEGAAGFAAGHFHGRAEIGFGLDHAHAAATAAPAGLEHHRVADFGCGDLGLGEVIGQGIGGGHHRYAGAFGEMTGGDLVAETAHGIGAGADEADAGLGAGVGEVRVLGEQAVTGVNRIHMRLFGHADDVVDVEVGRDRALAFAHQVGLVGLEAVQREAVFLGVDRHGADIHLAGGAEHANGDLGSVGDEDALDRVHGVAS